MTADRPATAAQPSPAGFVLSHARLRPVPLVPEIALHLADDAFSVWEDTERHASRSEQPAPCWAFAWAGGQALARYVLDHPDHGAGRPVLDLGSGSGLAAIAAARAGASAVRASETDPFAHAAIMLNAAANKVPVTVTGDVLDGSGEDAEVILAADIWYEHRLAARALGLLQRARARGASALAGDIRRTVLPRPPLRELGPYAVPAMPQLYAAAEQPGR